MHYLNQGKLMEAILIPCCNQGSLLPSTNATRFIASCGVQMQAAAAAGILGFGEHHGGVIASCAVLLQSKLALTEKKNADDMAAEIIEDFTKE